MKKSKNSCDLQSCLMCRLCQQEWIPAIAAHRSNYAVKKGEIIFREGEEMEGIYFVYSGSVKVHKHWGDKELILRFAKKGNIIGHRGFAKDLLYPVSGTAIEPVSVCFVDLAFFKATLKVNHELLYELMLFYATELKESERNMRNLAHMPVKGRIAQALLTLEEKFGKTEDNFIDIALSRQDLASFVGTAYETLFRMLNEMVEEGAVAFQGKHIMIAKREVLVKYLQ